MTKKADAPAQENELAPEAPQTVTPSEHPWANLAPLKLPSAGRIVRLRPLSPEQAEAIRMHEKQPRSHAANAAIVQRVAVSETRTTLLYAGPVGLKRLLAIPPAELAEAAAQALPQ